MNPAAQFRTRLACNDPAAVRAALAFRKAHGVPWERAWSEVVGAVPAAPRVGHEDEVSVERFAYTAFREAYLDLGSPIGLAREDMAA